MSTTIATTILQQLGGARFRVMTGSREFVALSNGLQFRVGSGAQGGINKCRVVLDPSDTYTVEFWRVRAGRGTLIEAHADIYADQLQAVFTAATGFATRL